MCRDVSVEVLVQSLHMQKVCWGCVHRYRALLMPEQHGSIICVGMDGALADILDVSDDIMLHEGCHQFKV